MGAWQNAFRASLLSLNQKAFTLDPAFPSVHRDRREVRAGQLRQNILVGRACQFRENDDTTIAFLPLEQFLGLRQFEHL
jgi:hypothetical protein